MAFLLPGNRVIRISTDVLETFRRHRQVSFQDSESGGIILGSVFNDHVLINQATTPGNGDRRGPCIFHRHKERAQKIVNERFSKSQGKQIYIGEWHTHRQVHPNPSFKDKFEIKRAYRKSKLNLDFVVLIVVGNQNLLGNIWIGYQNEQGLSRCETIRL